MIMDPMEPGESLVNTSKVEERFDIERWAVICDHEWMQPSKADQRAILAELKRLQAALSAVQCDAEIWRSTKKFLVDMGLAPLAAQKQER